jgi:hypothetical protein
MPAKLSLYREKESDVEFLLDIPNYARHKEVTRKANLEISTFLRFFGGYLLTNLITTIIGDVTSL